MHIVYIYFQKYCNGNLYYLELALRIVEDIDELFEETLFGHISL